MFGSMKRSYNHQQRMRRCVPAPRFPSLLARATIHNFPPVPQLCWIQARLHALAELQTAVVQLSTTAPLISSLRSLLQCLWQLARETNIKIVVSALQVRTEYDRPPFPHGPAVNHSNPLIPSSALSHTSFPPPPLTRLHFSLKYTDLVARL